MPLFRYQAVTGERGVIDADSLCIAKERLRRQHVFITKIVPLKSNKKERVLSRPLLLAFTRELAQLLKAGLPLYESLLTIEEKYRRHPSHALLLDLCDHIQGGHSLSSALKDYPSTFDRVYLAMVQVAEQSGNLAQVFENLSQLIEKQERLKKQLCSALIYPGFLATFCVVVICALLFFVIPSVRELFEDRILHPVTMLVLATSKWANDQLPVLIFSALSCAGFLCFCTLTSQGKRHLYHFCLTLPFLKTLLLHAALVRFSRAFSMLLAGGIPVFEALSLSRNVVKSPLLEAGITAAENRVMQGERLSHAFENAQGLPPLVLRMLALAEETGKMEEAFFNLTLIYEEEMEKHLQQLNTFLQPALLITLGAIIGLVVLAILLPLTDVSSFTP